MSVLTSFIKNSLTQIRTPLKVTQTYVIPVRHKIKDKRTFVEVPKPGAGKAYRRIVHFPEKYTVEPLNVTNLGGRDPVTGRVVVRTLGGGVKHKYHWVKFLRDGPSEGPPKEEKVLDVLKCGCRTAHVALVAAGEELKYILATENMKPGDIIKTSKFIPLTPIQANEGDAYPLAALPAGTLVNNIQVHPSTESTVVHAAGCAAVIKKHLDDHVIVQLPSKREMAFERECMATVVIMVTHVEGVNNIKQGEDQGYFRVLLPKKIDITSLTFIILGKLSNAIHSSIPIGSAQKLRELGYRPRSGLWKRKTGRFGRKIRPLPPVGYYQPPKPEKEYIRCTLDGIKL